jgi:polyphosphate glucokinase
MTDKTVSSAAPAPAASPRASRPPVTLAIDIGGSGLKAMLLDPAGKPLSERERVVTPAVPTPPAVLQALDELHARLPGFDRVSAGFPGVIKKASPAWPPTSTPTG